VQETHILLQLVLVELAQVHHQPQMDQVQCLILSLLLVAEEVDIIVLQRLELLVDLVEVAILTPLVGLATLQAHLHHKETMVADQIKVHQTMLLVVEGEQVR
jgi:hypothetical protein